MVLIALFHRNDSATGRDLRSLADFVVPAYTAMNFAMLCAQDDPEFLTRTSGPRGTALNYAQHVKDEAIASLPYEDAAIILRAAADAARGEARQEMAKLTSNYPYVEAAKMIEWCRDDGERFVRAFIKRHDGSHAALLQQIEQAKR